MSGTYNWLARYTISAIHVMHMSIDIYRWPCGVMTFQEIRFNRLPISKFNTWRTSVYNTTNWLLYVNVSHLCLCSNGFIAALITLERTFTNNKWSSSFQQAICQRLSLSETFQYIGQHKDVSRLTLAQRIDLLPHGCGLLLTGNQCIEARQHNWQYACCPRKLYLPTVLTYKI